MGNQMTDEDRFLFDLQGYIVVPDALSAEELLALNEILDEQIKARLPTSGRIGSAAC